MLFLLSCTTNNKNRGMQEITPNVTSSEFISLPALSEQHYGHPAFWVYIYEANLDKIASPANIPKNTSLVIPDLKSEYDIDVTDSKEIQRANILSDIILKKNSIERDNTVSIDRQREYENDDTVENIRALRLSAELDETERDFKFYEIKYQKNISNDYTTLTITYPQIKAEYDFLDGICVRQKFNSKDERMIEKLVLDMYSLISNFGFSKQSNVWWLGEFFGEPVSIEFHRLNEDSEFYSFSYYFHCIFIGCM